MNNWVSVNNIHQRQSVITGQPAVCVLLHKPNGKHGIKFWRVNLLDVSKHFKRRRRKVALEKMCQCADTHRRHVAWAEHEYVIELTIHDKGDIWKRAWRVGFN